MDSVSFRFDIDGIADVKALPQILEVADKHDVKFTFFVNMGRSFDWRYRSHNPKIGKVKQQGIMIALATTIWNPNIGIVYKDDILKVQEAGHELGLHGGMNHAQWEFNLDNVRRSDIYESFAKAYNHFVELYGVPAGYCSPGYKYNDDILYMLDLFSFKHSSDMDGDMPFKPKGYNHRQIPVHLKGIDYKKGKDIILKQNITVLQDNPSTTNLTALDVLCSLCKTSGKKIITMEEIIK